MTAILAACSLFATSCRNAAKVVPAVAPETDCSQFVVITDVVPDAILEIRYYSTYNFVGAYWKYATTAHTTLWEPALTATKSPSPS